MRLGGGERDNDFCRLDVSNSVAELSFHAVREERQMVEEGHMDTCPKAKWRGKGINTLLAEAGKEEREGRMGGKEGKGGGGGAPPKTTIADRNHA